MRTRYLIFSLATLFYTCNTATAEFIPMVVSAADVKVFHGTKVIAKLMENQMVYQTARKGRWIGVHWEDKNNGKMLRGWVRNTFLIRAPKAAIEAIGTPAQTPSGNPAQPVPAQDDPAQVDPAQDDPALVDPALVAPPSDDGGAAPPPVD